MKKLINNIKYRIFCYWCLQEGHYHLSRYYKHIPIDTDSDDEGNTVGIYGDVCLCADHKHQLDNAEGIYERND